MLRKVRSCRGHNYPRPEVTDINVAILYLKCLMSAPFSFIQDVLSEVICTTNDENVLHVIIFLLKPAFESPIQAIFNEEPTNNCDSDKHIRNSLVKKKHLFTIFVPSSILIIEYTQYLFIKTNNYLFLFIHNTSGFLSFFLSLLSLSVNKCKIKIKFEAGISFSFIM